LQKEKGWLDDEGYTVAQQELIEVQSITSPAVVEAFATTLRLPFALKLWG
jgi:hypothetical protein